ncbi:MAG: hypothetical protein QM692_21725 [Thermomicrobiales bacterium]
MPARAHLLPAALLLAALALTPLGAATLPGERAAAVAGLVPLTDLGTVNNEWNVAYDINNAGQIVGVVGGRRITSLALWDGGALTRLPHRNEPQDFPKINEAGDIIVATDIGFPVVHALFVPGGDISAAVVLPNPLGNNDVHVSDLNDAGQVVGFVDDRHGEEQAVVWTDGVPTVLSPPETEHSEAHAINELGQIVGSTYEGKGAAYRATFWDADGEVLRLPVPNNAWSEAYDINDAGVIVGEADDLPVAWINGEYIPLPMLGGSEGSAFQVNEAGQIIGWGTDSEGNAHMLTWVDGEVIDLGEGGLCVDINEAGQIICNAIASQYSADPTDRAYVWQDGETFELAPFPREDAWNAPSLRVWAINDDGVIVGRSDLDDPDAWSSKPKSRAVSWQAP